MAFLIIKFYYKNGGRKMENKHFLQDAYELKVANVILEDLETGVEMYSASLDTHQISQTVSEELIKAGQENDTFVTLTKSKEIKVTLEDIMAKLDWQAAKVGGSLEERELEVSAFPKNYKVKDSSGELVIELEHEPVNGVLPVIYRKDTHKAISTDLLTLEGKVITISDDSLSAGDLVFGSSYKYLTTSDSLMIDSGSKARHFRCEMHIPVLSSDLSLLFTKKIVFHKVAMSQNWEFSGATEISKNNQSTELTVLKHDDYDGLGYIVYEKPVA